jgi:hypothetical protein
MVDFVVLGLPPPMHLGRKWRALCAPPFSSVRHLQRHSMSGDMRDLCQQRMEVGREMADQFCLRFRLPCKSQEGMLWIFSPWKIRRLRPGSNPRSWVLEASMLTTSPQKPLSWPVIIMNFSLSQQSGNDVTLHRTARTCLQNAPFSFSTIGLFFSYKGKVHPRTGHENPEGGVEV